MTDPAWVSRAVVLALHERLIAEFGGEDGLRDMGLLESALARPMHLRAYANPTLAELAACYAYGLVKNHPFVDGNKRIGFTTAVLFLEINGCAFTAGQVDAVIQTLALAAGALSESGYAAWLAANTIA